MVLAGAFYTGHLRIGLAFLVGAFLTVIYLFRVFNIVFLGETKLPDVKEGSKGMLISVAALAALSVLLGIFINYPADFVNVVVSRLVGVIQ